MDATSRWDSHFEADAIAIPLQNVQVATDPRPALGPRSLSANR